MDDGRVLEWDATADGVVATERDDYTPRFYVAARDPDTGVSTDQKLKRLYELMREYYDGVIFILDEIDMLEGPYQEAEYNSLIYQLSRARKLADFDGPISLTVITNYADFMKDLNSRAQSSYNPDDIFFDDYDADQLRSILRNRRDAFKTDSLTTTIHTTSRSLNSERRSGE